MTLPGFHKCPECWGTGLVGYRGEHKPCPSCGGAGQVPDDDTVERVADGLADLPYDVLELRNWGDEPVPYVHVVVARRALLAYARHTQETKP